MNRAATIVPIALYGALALLVVPVFPHFLSPNEFSRWVQAVAIVDYHTVEVTPVVRDTGVRMEDLATIDGRLYSNKAPGGALVGLPAYAIARAIVGPPSASTMRTTLNAMRLLASTVPAILVALWLVAVARRLGCDENRIRFGVVALLFATPVFAYGLLFFAHALSALTLFGAWALLFVHERRSWIDIAAGAFIGLAVLTEYPSIVPAAVLILCALSRLRIAGLLRIMAGGAPFAVILAVYNQLAFGSVFTLSSAHEYDAKFHEMAQRGIFGVGLPSPEYLARLLFDPSKGLFVLSPILLVSFAGIATARRALSRGALVALLLTPLSIILIFAGYPNWFGGWTVGARYLVAAVPFFTLLIAFAARTWIEPILLGASVAAIALVSLVFPFVPPDYPAPWVSFAWPLLRDGLVAPNLLHFVSRALAIAIPFAMVITGVVSAVPRRAIALAIAGILIWIAAGMIAEARRTEPPALRAFIEEAYFGRKGAIARTLPGRNAIVLEAMARRLEHLPPPKWPF